MTKVEQPDRAPHVPPDKSREKGGFPWGAVLGIFLATRLGFFLVGVITLHSIAPPSDLGRNFICPDVHSNIYLDMFSRWDAEWYLLIAERGYDCAEVYEQNPLYEAGDTYGFFPLYPLTIRGATLLTGDPVLAGVILSHLFFLGALLLLAALVMHDFSRRTAILTVAFIALFPGAVFFGAVYSESLFLLLAVAVLFCARKRIWWPLLPLGAALTLTRPVGILFLLPVAWEYLRSKAWRPGVQVAWLAGFPLGLIGFMAFCAATFGDLLAFAVRQTAWRGTFTGPWKAFVRFFEDPAIVGSHNASIDFVVAVLAVSGVVFFARRLPFSYTLVSASLVVLPLCASLWSFTRFAAVVFPLFVGLADLSERKPKAAAVYFCLAPLIAGCAMVLFASWRWIG